MSSVSKLHVAQAISRLSGHRRTDMSFCEVLDFTNVSLDCVVGSLDPFELLSPTGHSSWTISVGMCVPGFVFDVDGA